MQSILVCVRICRHVMMCVSHCLNQVESRAFYFTIIFTGHKKNLAHFMQHSLPWKEWSCWHFFKAHFPIIFLVKRIFKLTSLSFARTRKLKEFGPKTWRSPTKGSETRYGFGILQRNRSRFGFNLRKKSSLKRRIENLGFLQKIGYKGTFFTDLHKVLFASFPTELHAWLSRIAENKSSTHSDKLARWTPEVIQRLKRTNNSISRVVDFWLTNLLEGFVTEFAVYALKAYS